MTTTVFPNLSAEMTRFGVSDHDIAVATGKSKRTVSNWLKGVTPITQDYCWVIRDTFFVGVPVDYLFDKSPSVAPVMGNSE